MSPQASPTWHSCRHTHTHITTRHPRHSEYPVYPMPMSPGKPPGVIPPGIPMPITTRHPRHSRHSTNHPYPYHHQASPAFQAFDHPLPGIPPGNTLTGRSMPMSLGIPGIPGIPPPGIPPYPYHHQAFCAHRHARVTTRHSWHSWHSASWHAQPISPPGILALHHQAFPPPGMPMPISPPGIPGIPPPAFRLLACPCPYLHQDIPPPGIPPPGVPLISPPGHSLARRSAREYTFTLQTSGSAAAFTYWTTYSTWHTLTY